MGNLYIYNLPKMRKNDINVSQNVLSNPREPPGVYLMLRNQSNTVSRIKIGLVEKLQNSQTYWTERQMDFFHFRIPCVTKHEKSYFQKK